MTFYQNQHRHGFPFSRYAGPGHGNWENPQEAHESPGGVPVLPKRTHPDHPNCPDSLNCLPDTDGKPNHILPVIVRSAILGSPKKRLTLRDIYAAIEEKWPYFRNAQSGWKDSIRHNLSLNRLFVKVPRPGTEPGFGSYWTVDLNAPPGSKRPRKRGTSNRNPSGAESAIYTRDPSNAPVAGPSSLMMAPYQIEPEDRNLNEPHTFHSGSDFEAEDDNQIEDPLSEYENEGASSPPDRRLEGFSTPPILPLPKLNEKPEEMIERLQAELIESQRQFSVASAFALRLSDQLEDAKETASTAQVKLRAAEEQLEEELVARVGVERRLEEEEGLRKEAEEELKNLLQKGGPEVKLFEAIRSIQDISKRALGR